jgi:signal transduction histidine kinase
VVEDLKSEAEAKHIEIQLAAPDPPPVVACSPGVLISMTTNLVANAIRLMGEALRRQITIGVRPVGRREVEIAVSDTGPGLAPELGAKVFQPHVRGHSSVPGPRPAARVDRAGGSGRAGGQGNRRHLPEGLIPRSARTACSSSSSTSLI